MPIPSKKSLLRKKILLISIFVIFGVGIYLNRSYAHIFDYDKNRSIVSMDIRRNYILNNGEGKENIKYVALGDSLTYGFGASNYQGTFPYIIANKLLKKYNQVDVVNLAIPGSVIDGVLESQLPKALEEKPGFVTLMIGTNDVHDFVNKQSFKADLISIVDQLKTQTSAQILLINIPYLGTRDLILPPYNEIMDLRISDFNEVIAEVAIEEQVGYFDLYSASRSYFEQNPKKYYSVDEFHPSDTGYILWGNLINVY